ncbi:MAG: excinuclease ABC subunit UvrA, partial [Candidatus Sumerlaeia bacterium]|nr:excinuclease ABC subunit UvrA [Candidatus Sumerlaeia bacterium]
MQNYKKIVIIGAHEHNLKYIDVEIPRNSFTVITGVSGSGKSSLAFDTIYAEGQRRYIESLSAYARQFLDQLPKPKVELITGLSPAVSIEQRTISHNPRSTVGTVTEIYDYLRLLFAHLGKPYCPQCGRPIERQTPEQIIERILSFPDGTKLMVMAPIVRGRKGEYTKLFDQLQREGFTRVLVDGKVYELGEPIKLKKTYKHNISLIVDRIILEKDIQSRLHSAIELALKKANGLVEVEIFDSTVSSSRDKSQTLLFSERFSCLSCGETIAEISPRLFSFNSPYGACPQCKGLGTVLEVEESLVVEPSKSVLEGALRPWESLISRNYTRNQNRILALLQAVAQKLGIDLNRPFSRLSKRHQQILLYGAGEELFSFSYSRGGKIFKETARYEGVIPYLQRRLNETSSETIREEILNFYADKPCPACNGQRLRPESLAVKFQDKNIAELARMSVKQLLQFFNSLQLTPREFQIGEQILKEIKDRLEFLDKVGLNYLDLDRRTETLAG